MSESIGELVRRLETEYIRGNTKTSKYVDFSMYEILNRIDAYLNSKHITGEFDSLGREKPFYNIVVAAANIWFRATDIDTKNIKIRATKSKDWLDSFLATILLQDWMRRERFGVFLNDWGRILARYGSAVPKFVENSTGLHPSVTSWQTLMVDPVDFASNPKIEMLELTEAQLYDRVETNGYDYNQVKALCDAVSAREMLDKQRKDNRTGYIKAYELHGKLSRAMLKRAQGKVPTEADAHKYVLQMEVISFVGTPKGRGKVEYQDFVLYAGKEKKEMYMITHLIEEDNRSLAIGAVEHLFESQWMMNHSKKNEKDALDISTLLLLQTADGRFVDKNVLDNMISGDILIHGVGANMNLTKIEMSKPELTQLENFAGGWKANGNEIVGVSEAMLGILPPSGTPAAQTQQLLQENYSLFELMVENKGLAIVDMMREHILDYIKRTELNDGREIAATLEQHDIDRIDSIYIKKEAIRLTNKHTLDAIGENINRIGRGEPVQPIDQGAMMQQNMQAVQDSLKTLGNTRYFKPSDLSEKTWKEQLKDLEWELEIDVTGESVNVRESMAALNTALQYVMQPGFDQNKKAQAIVGALLEYSGVMSPIQYNAIPSNPPAPPTATATSTTTPNPTGTGALQVTA